MIKTNPVPLPQMDITKTLATISAMRTKAIIQNKDRAVGLLNQLAVTAVAISKLSESVYSEDYPKRQELVKAFEQTLEQLPNKYKPYRRKK